MAAPRIRWEFWATPAALQPWARPRPINRCIRQDLPLPCNELTAGAEIRESGHYAMLCFVLMLNKQVHIIVEYTLLIPLSLSLSTYNHAYIYILCWKDTTDEDIKEYRRIWNITVDLLPLNSVLCPSLALSQVFCTQGLCNADLEEVTPEIVYSDSNASTVLDSQNCPWRRDNWNN